MNLTRSTDLDRIRSVLNVSREGMLIVDAQTRIVAANRPAVSNFARSGESIEQRRLSEVIRDLALHEAYTKALAKGLSSELKMDLIGGDRKSFEVRVSPIDLDDRKLAIGVFYDVTRLERLEKVRQEFLSNISHELRTPLTSIMAFVETLEDGAIDDKDNNRRFLSVIRRNAERMHELIADILELSMIESGNVSIEPKPVRLHAQVEDILTSLSSKAASRRVTLINSIDADARVTADPVRIEQMLTNLIDNAIKFNRVGGSVTITLNKTPAKSSISVTDTGEGIVAEHQHRIFERFYRADRGRTREIGGTGLGLAIVKHLARLHGGEVAVRSEPSVGTTFLIELPE